MYKGCEYEDEPIYSDILLEIRRIAPSNIDIFWRKYIILDRFSIED